MRQVELPSRVVSEKFLSDYKIGLLTLRGEGVDTASIVCARLTRAADGVIGAVGALFGEAEGV